MGIKTNRRKRNESIFDEFIEQQKTYPVKQYCEVCWEEMHSESACLRLILTDIAESLNLIQRKLNNDNN